MQPHSHAPRWRVVVAFVVLFALYQSAEGIGGRLLGNFAVQAGFMLAFVAAAWPLSRWLGYRGVGAWALDLRSGWFGLLVTTLLVAIGMKGLALLAGAKLGAYVPAANATQDALLAALPMLLLSTFVASIAEDILTRGFWFRASGIAWSSAAAFVAVSTLAYVLNHIYRIGNGPLEWAPLACFGFTCALALWRTGTLWAAVGLHWGWNLANGVFGVAWPLDIADPTRAALVSCAAHLVMAGLVMVGTRARK